MKNYSNFSLIVLLLISSGIQSQNLLWAKRIGSSSGESSYAIAVDQEGNCFSVGTFSLQVDFDPGPGSYLLTSQGSRDIYISKLDNNGNFVWANQIGGKLFDAAYALSLDPSGFVYVTGSFRDTVDFDPSLGESLLFGRKQSEVYLAKYDFNGNFIWAQKVSRSLDTLSSNSAFGLNVDPSGNVIVAGSFGTSADFNPGVTDEIHTAVGKNDIFISKYDASGNFLWVKNIGGAKTDSPYSIDFDGQGNLYCTGNFFSEVDFDPGPLQNILTAQDTFTDAFILKLNSSGEFVWVKQISGPGIEYGNSIVVDAIGNSYIAGSYSDSADFNYGNSPLLLPNSGYLDGYILSLNPNGYLHFLERISGPDDQEAWGIALAPGVEGGLYVGGYFLGQTSVDDFEIPPISSNNDGIDVFISKLDFNGNFKFLTGIGGPGYEFSETIAAGPSNLGNTIYSTGGFSSKCDFDPGIDEFPLTSAGSTDLYIFKMDDFTTGIENIATNEKNFDIQVSPNPSNEEIEITIPSAQNADIRILNNLGMPIQSLNPFLENGKFILNVSSIPSGMYFVQLNVDHLLLIKKFIISH